MLGATAFPVAVVPADASVAQDGAEPLLFYTQARFAPLRPPFPCSFPV
jgi:hypothetical protein